MKSQLLFTTIVLAFISCSEKKDWNQSVESPRMDSLFTDAVGIMNEMDFDSAQTLFNLLIIEAEATKSSRHAILGHLNMGNLYQYFGLEEEALEFFLTAMELSEESGDDRFIHSIYNNLGIFYSINGADEKAVDYFNKALAFNREQGRQEKVASNLVNLGTALDKIGEDEEAESSYLEAISILTAIGDSSNLSAAYNNLGSHYFDNQKVREAKAYYLKALKNTSPSSQSYYLWEYCLNLAKVYHHDQNLDSAQYFARKAVEGAIRLNGGENQITALRLLADIERELGKTSVADSLLIESMVLQDSILVKKTSQWVSDRELNFEFGKKEQELKDLQTKMKQRRTIAQLLTVLGVLLLLLITISIRARWKVLRQRNELLENEKELSRLAIEKRMSEEKRLKDEMEARERILKIEREKLQQEVDFKNRELVGKVINLRSQNDQFAKLRELLEEGVDGTEQDLQQTIKQALSFLRTSYSNTEDWESFKRHFEEVHPKFFENLRNTAPQLSAGEERMAAYLVLNLSPKEIAQISSISPDSVRKRKQRLREKFDLDGTTDLREYLLNFLEH